MFLLPGLGCPNFCRMTDQAFDSQLFHEVHKPLHRSRGFDAHSHRAWKRGIKLPHVVPSCFRVMLTTSPVSVSSIATACWRACKSHPIILISASFGPSTVG